MKNIVYSYSRKPDVKQVIDLYRNCGLPRPVDDEGRMATIYQNSNLIVTSWHDKN
ncbi:hypothetical protein [Galbibacter pacificus]|uniref:Uncharacterized protein n=1 Tax=Galbibacter pacificus TaxID=2996052 RepID=A0ABT6FR19_9FLAO|nr:hypothetical protein [Galbibacter pacificus]MDG3581840.1 hypothetical protein [Galbibacter pacificus]MDG3585686.1 hypothetical protein [Galbibacter pacificus]